MENPATQATVAAGSVRAVLFDAVGTLLAPSPSAAELYHEAARRQGSQMSPAEIERRFALVRREEEARDLETQMGRTNEALERRRWRTIFERVLEDVPDAERAFDELWEAFGSPSHWRPLAAAVEAARQIRRLGYRVGWASNFDSRLHRIVAGLGELAEVGEVFVSSELGYRKPHAGFFRAIEQRLGLRAEELLLVGDDRANDYEAAREAGWQAWLVPASEDAARGSLAQLIAALRRA